MNLKKTVLLLLLGCFLASHTVFADEQITLLSEHILDFSYMPVATNLSVQRLTDERLFFDYGTQNEETTKFYKHFGVDNMLNEMLEIMDNEGNSVACEFFRHYESDEDNYFSQIILEPDGFVYEFSFGLDLDSRQRLKRSYDGEKLGYTDKIYLADDQKGYVFNRFPYRVTIYPFSDQNPIRMEIRHIPNAQVKTCMLLYGEFFDFFETEGRLAVFSANEQGGHNISLYDSNCNLIKQIYTPFVAYNQVIEDQHALYFWVQETAGILEKHRYTLYSYDKLADTFSERSISYEIDGHLSVTLLQVCDDGLVAVLTDNQTRDPDGVPCGKSVIVVLEPNNALTSIVDLGQRVEWVDLLPEQQFMLLIRDVEQGGYMIQRYEINPF